MIGITQSGAQMVRICVAWKTHQFIKARRLVSMGVEMRLEMGGGGCQGVARIGAQDAEGDAMLFPRPGLDVL